MLRSALTATLLLCLAACGASVAPATSADGQQTYVAKCGGVFGSPLDCGIEATKTCGSGYVPVEHVPGSGRLTFTCGNRPRG